MDGHAGGTLRTRRIARNRQHLVAVGLPAFAERGYERVTVDWLCDQAEVSKRTFFRYFDGKEDLALTPLNDVWRTLIADLDDVLARPGALLDLLGDALADVVGRMPDGWERLAVLSHRLAADTAAVEAAALLTCERFTRRTVDAVADRHADLLTAGPTGRFGRQVAARVVCATVIAVYRAAFDVWQSAPDAEHTATRVGLCDLLREGFADARAARVAVLP